jgi:hypothetical protein
MSSRDVRIVCPRAELWREESSSIVFLFRFAEISGALSMLQLPNLQWVVYFVHSVHGLGRGGYASCLIDAFSYQARILGTSDASHDVSFHSMHKMMCLAVCRRSLIDFTAVMKENLLRTKTCAFWCEVYLDLPAYLVSLCCAYQFLRQTVGWLTYRKWWRREQCEPKMDIQASCDV